MEQNQTKEFMSTSFGDEKLSKEMELNSTMSISPQTRDEYEQKIKNIGGNE